jgi:hypothetical protein
MESKIKLNLRRINTMTKQEQKTEAMHKNEDA